MRVPQYSLNPCIHTSIHLSIPPSIHPSIHPAKKEEKSNRGESTPVFLLIIERTLTIEEAELCVRSSSYPFDVCSKKCRYGNWSSLLNRHARNGGRLLLTFWIGKTTEYIIEKGNGIIINISYQSINDDSDS